MIGLGDSFTQHTLSEPREACQTNTIYVWKLYENCTRRCVSPSWPATSTTELLQRLTSISLVLSILGMSRSHKFGHYAKWHFSICLPWLHASAIEAVCRIAFGTSSNYVERYHEQPWLLRGEIKLIWAAWVVFDRMSKWFGAFFWCWWWWIATICTQRSLALLSHRIFDDLASLPTIYGFGHFLPYRCGVLYTCTFVAGILATVAWAVVWIPFSVIWYSSNVNAKALVGPPHVLLCVA